MSLAKKMHEQGCQEGRQEGEIATKQSIAQQMLEESADIEFIAKITGYTVQELEVLARLSEN